MLRLGKQTHYALMALFHLDRVDPGARVSTHDLSMHYDVPEPHLGKVLQKLSRAGLLRAVKGVQGGYELNQSLDSLELGDVLEALHGDKRPRVLPGSNHRILTAFPSCYMQGMVRELEHRVYSHLHRLKISDLLQEMDVPSLSPLTMEAVP